MAESYTGWSRRDTRGASSSDQGDKNETWRGVKEFENESDKDEKGDGKGKNRQKKTQRSLSARRTRGHHLTTKVYDLNQKTMQALDPLAAVYATFEDAWANVENEISEGDMLFAEAYEAVDELAKAQQHQDPKVTTWPS